MLPKKRRSLVVTEDAYSVSPRNKIFPAASQQTIHRSRAGAGEAEAKDAEDRVEQRILQVRKAFDDTMKDPAFLAEMEKEQLPVHPLTGEEAGQIVAKITVVSPAIIAKAKKIYE